MSVKRKQFPVELKDVEITGGLIGQRAEKNAKISIADQYRKCLKTGRIDAIRLKWKAGQPDKPHQFWDSDVAKWVEAAAYTLMKHKNSKLAAQLEDVVTLFIQSQQPEGYINSYIMAVEPEYRWKNLQNGHELYTAGHIIEAAVAYYQYCGNDRFLKAACRFGDYIAKIFGPGKDQIKGYPGHQEIELALVKLYRTTKNPKYLELAKFFLDRRGTQPSYFKQEAANLAPNQINPITSQHNYLHVQAHKPVREQHTAVGHAVRACYMYGAMADVAAETGDSSLFSACRRLFKNISENRMYITGGIGSSQYSEAFTCNYNLPNMNGYAETCAAVALVFFAHRMLQIDPDSKYADVMERALYNNVLAGVSLAGNTYFYANLLKVVPAAVDFPNHGSIHSKRQNWMDCACCPSNYSRLISSLGGYIYTSARQGPLYIHLYTPSKVELKIGRTPVRLEQQTDYPWDGKIIISVTPAEPVTFSLMLRVPQWCENWRLKVNGIEQTNVAVKKGYILLRRQWLAGDAVELTLEMPVQRIVSHPDVDENVGKIALQRGPLVYCLEECDNPANVHAISLPTNAEFKTRFDKALLGGCVVIETSGFAPDKAGWSGRLYQPAAIESQHPIKVKAVPYFLWCNRKPGNMTVWINEA
ncbi:MAG TPA: glycoside hydrolase family 127 protein [Phycisphaerae bacterium]|nr:glycoside hydrolase family 127 protein [Phycisphaerae bacterium]